MNIFKKLLSANHIFALTITIVTVSIVGYFWINDQYKTFEEHSVSFQSVYMNSQNKSTQYNIEHIKSDINTILLKEYEKLEEKINDDIKQILLILLSIMLFTIILIELWNRKLHKSFREFTEFFKVASVQNIHLEEDNVSFIEFKELTHLANDMVTSREKIEEQLKEQAYKDPLTNIYNRRYFYEVSEELLSLSKRDKTPLCMMMIDIDKFKDVNDIYGHIVGDEVIITLANKLIELVRGTDVVSRFGGEEFAIIFPNADIESCYTIAEKIRLTIEDEVVRINKLEVKYTVSIGISEFDYANNNTLENMLDTADKSLYQAKESGRNKVCIHKN